MENNPFLTLQQEFSSQYKIDKFVKSASNYIPPREVKLPPNSEGVVRSFQYVPVVELVEAIVSSPGYNPAPELELDSGLLHDVKDGSAWRNNSYFKENPTALPLMLYSDEVEICNPLGQSKGVHKILNVYMTLADIRKHDRSKIDKFFLVLTVRSKDMKGNREAVYDPLIKDLLKLEEGVPSCSGTIKAGVLAHLGDNLEAHLVSGLSTSFSSKDICRLCHMQVLVNLQFLPQ
jgi:hypothetical protein